MTNEPVLLALSQVWKILEPLNKPMAVLGGIALASWGHSRFTQDVDILMAVEDKNINEVVELARNSGMRTKREPPAISLGDIQLVQFLFEPPETYLDLQVDLLFASSEYHLQALERRVPAELPSLDVDLMVLSCEDLALLKLLAGRLIDLADTATLLRMNRDTLDLEYLRKWTSQLELDDEMRQVWNEAFPDELPPVL
jgi:hypothetical protein